MVHGSPVEAHLRYYRSQHRTLGCKLTHLVGIPLIALSVPMLLLNWRRSLAMFSLGWILQFIGHFVFEKNSPVLFSANSERKTMVILSALLFVSQEWLDTLLSVREQLFANSNGRGSKLIPLRRGQDLDERDLMY